MCLQFMSQHRQLVTGFSPEARVQCQSISHEICDGQSGTVAWFPPSTLVFLCQWTFHHCAVSLISRSRYNMPIWGHRTKGHSSHPYSLKRKCLKVLHLMFIFLSHVASSHLPVSLPPLYYCSSVSKMETLSYAVPPNKLLDVLKWSFQFLWM
jgi:hypothetical protein